MRISGWSSDVCSSDLEGGAKRRVRVRLLMLPAKSRALTPTPLPKAGEGLPIARSVRRVTLPSPQSPVPAPPPMRIDIISLFPEFVAQVAGHGVVGRAQEDRKSTSLTSMH